MSLLQLGIPVLRSRRVAIGKVLFTGETGAVVHPVTFEHFAALAGDGPPIDDFEAVRRAAARSFDERWNRRVRNAAWAREQAA